MSGRYNTGRDALAAGAIAWVRDIILANLVSAQYVFDPDHNTVATWHIDQPIELTGKSVRDGWLKCDSLKFSQVSGPPAGGIVFYSGESGVLIEFHDAIDHFPMIPNGGDIEIAVADPGIFRV